MYAGAIATDDIDSGEIVFFPLQIISVIASLLHISTLSRFILCQFLPLIHFIITTVAWTKIIILNH